MIYRYTENLWDEYFPFDQSLSEFSAQYIFLSDRSPEEEQEFRDYVSNFAERLIYLVLLICGVLILATWPTDYIIYESEAIRTFYVKWRLITVGGIGFVLGGYHLTEYIHKNFITLVMVGVVIVNFTTAYLVGQITNLQDPWFHIIYITAFYSVFLPTDLFKRVLLTVFLPTSWGVGFVAFRPELWGYPYFGFVAIIALTVIIISIILGHAIYAVMRENFFRNQELKTARQEIKEEQEKSEELLLNILPATVSRQLKKGKDVAEQFDEATVLFADIVEFTPLANNLPAHEVVEILDDMFSALDRLVSEHGLEKIKTIGDEYFVAAGVPEPMDHHAVRMAELAVAMKEEVQGFTRDDGRPFQLRMGMNSGPLVGGIIGEEKFVYDVWGDTVNLGSRMESQGVPGKIQVTSATKDLIQRQGNGRFAFEERGTIDVKGRGEMITYFLG